MNHELSMAYLAVRLTEQHVRRARPDAPTVPERPARHPIAPLATALVAGVRRVTRRTGPSRRTQGARPETGSFGRSSDARI